jgi:hypothetical protein
MFERLCPRLDRTPERIAHPRSGNFHAAYYAIFGKKNMISVHLNLARIVRDS